MDSEFGSISASGRGRLSYLLFLFCSKPDFVIVLPCQSLCFSVYTACCHAFLRTINHGPHSSTALCCHCDQLCLSPSAYMNLPTISSNPFSPIGCSRLSKRPRPLKMISHAEVGDLAGMDSEFGFFQQVEEAEKEDKEFNSI